MARTNLAIQQCGRLTVLTDPTQNTPDAVNFNSFDNSTTRVIMYITNGSGGDVVVTVDTNTTAEGETLPNKIYTLATGTRTVIGPFPASYNQTDNSLTNRVLVDFDVSTSVTVELIQVPAATENI